MKIHDTYDPGHYVAAANRYDDMVYRRCGRSGLLLPAISIGLWHNFGHVDDLEVGRKMLRRCFDFGITHFDLSNNYGPPFGAAEDVPGDVGEEMPAAAVFGAWLSASEPHEERLRMPLGSHSMKPIINMA